MLAGAAVTLAVVGLAGCRTSPNVAAYVGDEQITVDELQTAVDQRLADPDIASYAKGKSADFRRQVLTELVGAEVYAAAAKHYGVDVSAGDVQRRVDSIIGGNDPDAVFTQLAQQQGINRADAHELVREQMLRQAIAVEEGLVDEPTDASLRARYDQVKSSLGTPVLGYITVPDQATADAVLAQLTADPGSYASVAAQYKGDLTLAQPQPTTQDKIPQLLADGVAKATPGTGFTVPIDSPKAVVVAFVPSITYPSFAQVRPQLEQEALAGADDKATKLVDDLRSDLGVRINPRYGVLDSSRIVPDDGGVVDILGTGSGSSGS